MNVGVLTSSRADFGIYLPLLKVLKKDPYFSVSIIAFGTHLSPFHGNTIDNIAEEGFVVDHKIETVPVGDSAKAISSSMALTMSKFADFWEGCKSDFDLVFCLGDRYEMFAAVYAAVPYGIKFAHFHGGETTLGAIDNKFRHSISIASDIHFVSTENYGQKVAELTGTWDDIYVVGALSLDNIHGINLLSIEEIKRKFKIDLSTPTILFTFHPETINADRNSKYAMIITETVSVLSERYQIIVTLPNADTENLQYRNAYLALEKELEGSVKCVESFGTQGYFSMMRYCSMLLGNTSSGIIEAATFGKRVIDIGDRQKGRVKASNVLNVPVDKKEILDAVHEIEGHGPFEGDNPYYQGGAVMKVVKILKAHSSFRKHD